MLSKTLLQAPGTKHALDRAMEKRTATDRRVLPSLIGLGSAPLSFGRNAEIYGEREPADCLYKVISGAVRTCRALIDGRRQIGGFYLPGDGFGIEAGNKHAFSAEAVVDSTVLPINRSIALSFAGSNIAMARHLCALLERELQRAQAHSNLLVQTAPERVASFILEIAERIESSDEIELLMSRQDIADYLGLTIETVSRTLGQLEDASAIALPTSKRIVLRNRAVLNRLIA